MRNRFLRFGAFFGAGCLLASCVPSLDTRNPLGDAAFVPGEARPLKPPKTEEAKDAEMADALPTFEDPGGDLGLRELTTMALANSPQFAEAAGNLRVARARWKVVGEWEDPQFRGGFDWEDLRIDKVDIPGTKNDDVVRRTDSASGSLRFFPPNPFEVRAQLDKAMAEISFAEFAVKQAGRDIIVDVRRLYQELQFIQEGIQLGKGLHRLELEEYERLKQIMTAGDIKRDPVDSQRIAALSKRGIASSAEIRFQKVRSELAALVGLGDATRIAVSGVPNRPILGFREDTVSSLSEMAFINNLKLGDLDRLQKLAQGDLKAFKAKRIPWVSFIQAGGAPSFSEGHRQTSTEWSVRLAIDVPIFSLFSAEGDIYKEQIRSYQEQAKRYQKQIQRRVASGVANIREARSGLARYDRETQEILEDMKGLEAELSNPDFQRQQAGLIHRRKLMSLGRSRERLAAEQAYHDALLNLEEIIREDIEKVFRKRG